MEPKQAALFDACMRQAEYFAGRWDRRRTDEWKTTVAIWGFLLGGIYYVKNQWLPGIRWKLAALILVVIFGYVRFWLMPVWKANDFDKTMGYFYRDQAAEVTFGADQIRNVKEVKFKPASAFWKDWSMWFQILSVLVLSALFFVVPR